MHYVIEFDIAALIIEFLVVIFFHVKKKMPIFQNKVFCFGCYYLILMTFLDMFTTVISDRSIPLPRWAIYFFNCMYLTTSSGISVFFGIYIYSLVDFWSSKNRVFVRILALIYAVPFILNLIMIWLSPVFQDNIILTFYLDENNNYVRGNFWFKFIYVISFINILFVFFVLFSKRITRENRILILVYIFFLVIGALIQFFDKYLLVECFAMALTLLTLFFFIQRPEDVIDNHTKIFNQNAFLRMYSPLSNTTTNYTVISLVLDDTVFIADTFGIHQLYNFMRLVANFLVENFKFSNVFRISQSSFVIVLKNIQPGEIYEKISLLQSRFKGNWQSDSIIIKLYKRICIIEAPMDASSPSEIMEIINLIENDERYKQSVVFFKDIDIEYKRRNNYIEHSLRLGFVEDRFDVYYQPIYSVAKKRIIGAEALVRLTDDNGEFISPEDFIPIAEKNGTVLRIGEFVFESVCKTLSKTDLQEYGIEKIDINLSVAQCMQEVLAEHLLSVKSLYNVPSSVLNLEITETAAAHTPDILYRNMKSLADAGIELSLDDYGSGYSNMSYMLNLPFKMIKIDKNIVWSAFESERSAIALKATITMIKSLGMTVLAEGVETRAQAEWLILHGCDYLQGFLFSKPVPKEDFLKIIKDKNNPVL